MEESDHMRLHITVIFANVTDFTGYTPKISQWPPSYLFKDHMKWGRASNTSRPFEIKDCHPNLCHTHQDLRIDLHSGPWCFSVRSLEDLGVDQGPMWQDITVDYHKETNYHRETWVDLDKLHFQIVANENH